MTTKTLTLASLTFAMSLVAGCGGSGGSQKLPGLSFTPQLSARQAGIACGDDVDWSGDGSLDARYTYAFDDAGQLSHATGVFTAGGPDDNLDYSYDGAGNFTHLLESTGAGGSTYEVSATYDGGNLATYATAYDGPDGHQGYTYALSDYTNAQPGTEVISVDGGGTETWTLSYDADGRLVSASSDQGDRETWTYDDAAGTITVEEDGGAFTGVIAYDADFREMSEVWGGSSPAAVASVTTFTWEGEELVSESFQSGTEEAPTVLQMWEVDTLRYDCESAAKAAPRAKGFRHPQGRLAVMGGRK